MEMPTNIVNSPQIINIPRQAKKERRVHFAEEPEYLIQSVAPKLPYVDAVLLQLLLSGDDDLYGRGMRQLKCLWAEAGVKLGFNDSEIKGLVCLMMSPDNLSLVAKMYPELFSGNDAELRYQFLRYIGGVCDTYCDYAPELIEWFDETYSSLLHDGATTRETCEDNANYQYMSLHPHHHTILENRDYSSTDDDDISDDYE